LNNTIELTVSNFFYEDPKTRTQVALDVFLGNLGPLPHRVYQTSPPGPLTSIGPYVQPLPGMDGVPADSPTSPNSPVGGPPRFMPSGPLHTIVVVEMPPIADVIKALEDDALPLNADRPENSDGTHPPDGRNGSGPPPSINGRSLPLLFIRSLDGVGYHSGRTIACENVFHLNPLNGQPPHPGSDIDTGWLTAAHAAVGDGGLQNLPGWTLRVM
jgi:recombining binding protein suppressor of hairless